MTQTSLAEVTAFRRHRPEFDDVVGAGPCLLPGAVDFTFGGPDRNVLYITTDSAVFAAVLDAQGA